MKQRRGRAAVIALSLAASGLLSSCGSGGQHSTSAPSASAFSSSSVPRSGPTTSRPTVAPCTPASAVARWSVRRRAAALVIVPVLNFNVAGAIPDVAAGASGILFLGTGSPPASLAGGLQGLTATARANGNLLVMADEEGGGVQRLVPAVSSLPWPRDMALTMSPEQVTAAVAAVARQMRALGVTVDLAPVADVDAGPGPSTSNPDGRRSFSGDPATAARYTVAFLTGLREGGVLPVVKHFPGLGGSTGNTDFGPASTLPLSRLKLSAFPPFAAAIGAGTAGVMVANASVPEASSLPASLSFPVISGLLRSSFRYSGLVLTDSLSAGAIRAVTPSLSSAAARAIAAGADLVLFGSTLSAADVTALQPGNVQRSFEDIVSAVSSAVDSHQISESALNEHVVRVLAARHVNPCG